MVNTDTQTIAQNAVEITPDDIIFVKEIGYQTEHDATEVRKLTDIAAKKLQRDNKKTLVLVDLEGITGHNKEARITGTRILRDTVYDGVAIYGGSALNRVIVNWMISLAGRGVHVRYCEDRKAAEKWLRSR